MLAMFNKGGDTAPYNYPPFCEMAMKIATNTVVQLHYSLFDEQDTLIESTEQSEPVLYLHGHNNMIAGFEQAIAGQEAGNHASLVLSPEQAYGQPKVDAQQRVPVKHLQGAKQWRAGMPAWLKTEQGMRQVTVVKVGRFMADIDTNHPLAGKTLRFEVDIIDVRAATAEEVAHKHAHGVGGHQH